MQLMARSNCLQQFCTKLNSGQRSTSSLSMTDNALWSIECLMISKVFWLHRSMPSWPSAQPILLCVISVNYWTGEYWSPHRMDESWRTKNVLSPFWSRGRLLVMHWTTWGTASFQVVTDSHREHESEPSLDRLDRTRPALGLIQLSAICQR